MVLDVAQEQIMVFEEKLGSLNIEIFARKAQATKVASLGIVIVPWNKMPEDPVSQPRVKS